jgi:formylglycine-generating enzyme required for sulfatase activity
MRAALLLLLCLSACQRAGERPCQTSDECVQGERIGECLPSPTSELHWCAYPDDACVGSDQRWSQLAGDGLGDVCVEASSADASIDAGSIFDASEFDASEADAREPDAAPDASVEGMQFVAEGPFYMGCDAMTDAICNFSTDQADEQPFRPVALAAFWIDGTEVTQGDYKACVDDFGCTLPGVTTYWNPTVTPLRPVSGVTWSQAVAYCTWNGGKRLPTEAEWEKAARGTDGRRYPWGPATSVDCAYANVGTCPPAAPVQVGSYPSGASPCGAMDMAGNVAEWVADYYQDDYYSTAASTDPPGPATGTERVVRGGSYALPGHNARTSDRQHSAPLSPSAPVGFRCAR